MQLIATHLGHQFPGGGPLFGQLDFTLAPGDMVAVTGPSGSGKSTLLSILAGWTVPTAGTLNREGAGSVAWVPQNPYGMARRTALDHVALPLLAAGHLRRSAEEAARPVLDDFGLTGVANARYAQLSGGEAQRLLLAQAVLSEPAVLLVDEPTAQLDPVNAEAVIGTLHSLAGAGRIVVIASHDTRVAAVCARRIHLGVP